MRPASVCVRECEGLSPHLLELFAAQPSRDIQVLVPLSLADVLLSLFFSLWV